MEWSYENVVCKLLPVFSWPSSNQWSSVQFLKHIISQTFQNCLMFSAYKSAILFWQYYNSLLMHSFVMKQFSHGIVPLSNFLQWTWWRKRSEDFFSGTMRPVGVWSFWTNPKWKELLSRIFLWWEFAVSTVGKKLHLIKTQRRKYSK